MGFRVSGFGLGLTLRDYRFGFRVSGFGFEVSGFGFGFEFRFRVSGFGFRDDHVRGVDVEEEARFPLHFRAPPEGVFGLTWDSQGLVSGLGFGVSSWG